MQHASGIPWTLPLGLLSGVFISACASIQIKPSFSPRRRKNCETPRDRSHRDGMIAAEHQRELAGAQRAIHHLRHQRVQVSAICGRYLARECPSGVAFALDHRNVAEVFHFIAQRREPPIEIGHAHGRGTHVDAAPSLAEIERRADDRDVLRTHGFGG